MRRRKRRKRRMMRRRTRLAMPGTHTLKFSNMSRSSLGTRASESSRARMTSWLYQSWGGQWSQGIDSL
jgi:hypothetical protein